MNWVSPERHRSGRLGRPGGSMNAPTHVGSPAGVGPATSAWVMTGASPVNWRK